MQLRLCLSFCPFTSHGCMMCIALRNERWGHTARYKITTQIHVFIIRNDNIIVGRTLQVLGHYGSMFFLSDATTLRVNTGNQMLGVYNLNNISSDISAYIQQPSTYHHTYICDG
jgi:hypothetical protein